MNVWEPFTKLGEKWMCLIGEDIELLKKISDILEIEKQKYEGLDIFPPCPLIFNTFTHIQPDEIKIVILGQDCYHKKNQAIGRCFAVENNIKNPPSLRNIIKEVKSDTGCELQDSSLLHWNTQGVLLLNTALTVTESCPGSHLHIWKPFIMKLLEKLNRQNPSIIYLLWGKFSQNLYQQLDYKTQYNLTASHPSPLSANRGGWFGSRHFTKANEILKQQNKIPIQWYSNI